MATQAWRLVMRSSLMARCTTTGIQKRILSTTTQQVDESASGEKAFIAQRQADLEMLQQRGIAAYPHLQLQSTWLPLNKFRNEFSKLEPDQKLLDVKISISGRIVQRRESSSKLVFYEVRDMHDTVQILVSAKLVDDISKIRPLYQRGDVVEISGFPGKTVAGELSVFATEIKMLAPCLRPLPVSDSLKDPQKRTRFRHVDLIVNSSSRETFILRSKVIREIRRFLEDRSFLEVETPILSTSVGGASAKPFETVGHSIGLNMRMRISPELFLKRLVIGGFDRVFEIGKQFRNEGIDATHNPEFTTCEFYQAYATYDALMKTTEEMLSTIATAVKGSSVVQVHSRNGELIDVDFAAPYKVIDIVSNLEHQMNTKLPDVNHPNSIDELVELCHKHNVIIEKPFTASRLLDSLVGHFIEPLCQQPTFLCHHPIAMSPLAKEHPTKSGVTSRFELIVGGRELVNAYSELNDPVEQRQRFAQQAQERQQGDNEAHETDADFCQALEYGLPPTAGWGLGVDRLVMMLTGTTHLRDVLLFPVSRPTLDIPSK